MHHFRYTHPSPTPPTFPRQRVDGPCEKVCRYLTPLPPNPQTPNPIPCAIDSPGSRYRWFTCLREAHVRVRACTCLCARVEGVHRWGSGHQFVQPSLSALRCKRNSYMISPPVQLSRTGNLFSWTCGVYFCERGHARQVFGGWNNLAGYTRNRINNAVCMRFIPPCWVSDLKVDIRVVERKGGRLFFYKRFHAVQSVRQSSAFGLYTTTSTSLQVRRSTIRKIYQ